MYVCIHTEANLAHKHVVHTLPYPQDLRQFMPHNQKNNSMYINPHQEGWPNCLQAKDSSSKKTKHIRVRARASQPDTKETKLEQMLANREHDKRRN